MATKTRRDEHAEILATLRRSRSTGLLDDLPPELRYVQDLAPLVEQQNRLRAEIKAASAQVLELRRERSKAAAAEARAMRHADAGPGRSTHVIDAEISELEGRSVAAKAGLVQIQDERARLLDRNKALYLAELDEALKPARAAVRAAIDQTEGGLRALAEIEAAYRSVTTGAPQPIAPVPPVIDGQRVDTTLAHLREAFEDPEPKPDESAPRKTDWQRYEELVSGQRAIGNGWNRLEGAAPKVTVT